MHFHRHKIAVSGLLFGAACWGIIWYPYRLMQEAGVSGIASSFYTYLIAAVLGSLIFIRHWRGVMRLPQSAYWLALAAGWTNLSYVIAIIDGEVMRVMLLFYLSPLWTLILAHFWLHEPIDRNGLIVIATSLIGAYIMLWQPDTLPLPRNQAEWMALSSGMAFALTNVITRRSSHLSLRVKSMAVWIGVIFVSGLMLYLEQEPLPRLETLSLQHWILMGLIALILMSATLLVQFGLTVIPVTRAAVIFLFELVVAAVASYYWANEAMSIAEWSGGILIVIAAIIAARAETNYKGG
jgi:drug/metabolite transporter (DMT)-like permease